MANPLDVGPHLVRRILRTLLMVVGLYLLVSFIACPLAPPFYISPPTHGTVVDAATSAPLEGVIVVAHWILETHNGSLVGEMEIMETTTNGSGHFEFAGWGPRLRWPLHGYVTTAPDILLFKPGYIPNSYGSQVWLPHYNPRFDAVPDVTTPLSPTDDMAKYVNEVGFMFSNQLRPWAFNRNVMGGCAWKHIPALLGAIDDEGRRIGAPPGATSRIPTSRMMDESRGSLSCGSVQKFLQEGRR